MSVKLHMSEEEVRAGRNRVVLVQTDLNDLKKDLREIMSAVVVTDILEKLPLPMKAMQDPPNRTMAAAAYGDVMGGMGLETGAEDVLDMRGDEHVNGQGVGGDGPVRDVASAVSALQEEKRVLQVEKGRLERKLDLLVNQLQEETSLRKRQMEHQRLQVHIPHAYICMYYNYICTHTVNRALNVTHRISY